MSRTILGHIDRSQDALNVPRSVQADLMALGRHVAVREVVLDHAQLLDRTAWYALQSVAVIDTLDENRRVLPLAVHSIHNDRRAGPGAYGQGFQQRDGWIRIRGQQHDIVVDIHQVDSEVTRRIGRQFCGHQEERGSGGSVALRAQWIRMQELRPAFIHQFVQDDRIDLLAVAGNACNGTTDTLARSIAVEQHQLAHPFDTVVSGDNTDRLTRIARAGACVEDGIRPVVASPQILALLGAVRVHREQDAGHKMRQAGILPAQVESSAVGQHGGTPVLVLLEGQLAYLPGFAIQPEQIGHLVMITARDRFEAGG